MTTNDRQGTFWVIDGIRIKKKRPFVVNQVERVMPTNSHKQSKDTLYQPGNDPVVPVEEKNFFTEKSYQDLADKRMDYGMIRFSSLSSMRGQLFSLGHVQQMAHNFSYYGSNETFKSEAKRSIFENKFSLFQYINEESQEDSQADNMIGQ